MGEILTVLSGVLKFWDIVSFVIKSLQGTPAEQVNQRIAAIHAAFAKDNDPKNNGNTSDIEKEISG